MTEQRRPEEDVEGHAYRRGQDTQAIDEDQVADDTEGHIRFRQSEDEASEDDVEGHRRKFHLDPEASGDDVEGHVRARVEDEASEDDVQGYSPARRPL